MKGTRSNNYGEWKEHVHSAFRRYRSKATLNEAKEWFTENYARIAQIFEDERVRDFIFQPFRKFLQSFENTTDGQVKAIITQVALANAVLAGLPGKLGVGVYVCMALEAWMALRIAGFVGVRINSPAEIFKYVGVFSGVALTITWLFTHLLRGTFSLLSLIPVDIPLTVVAELLVTNLVGIMFWFAFQEAAENRSFRVPLRMMRRVYSTTSDLLAFQIEAIRQTISLQNLKMMGERLVAWLKGDLILPEPARLRGEVLIASLIAVLRLRRFSELEGPMGEMFLQSIRDRWSRELSHASEEEIAEYMDRYDGEQMLGVINVIKGKMFEHLVATSENADGDVWKAYLHDNESYPGSDIIFTNLETGEEIEVSLKAVSDPGLIERALLRYPDIPIITTSEMSAEYSDVEMVFVTKVSDAELEATTEYLFDEMMEKNSTVWSHYDAAAGIGVGTSGAMVASLWPFVVAHLRGKITRDQLIEAFHRAMGEGGRAVAVRIAIGAALGPVYVWYLLAKGVMQLAPNVKEVAAQPIRLEFIG